MRFTTLAVSMLAIGLTFASTPTFARTLRPAPAAPQASKAAAPKIEKMLPGNTSGAVFVNVKRLYALYGDLITRSPGYEKVAEVVAKGLPDPAKDIDTVGIVSNLESNAQSAVGVVMTGRIDMARFMKAAEVESHAQWVASSFRGVTFQTADVDGQNMQMAQPDESTTILSFDGAKQHPHSKAIVTTLTGATASFGQVNKLTLPAGWILNGSIQVPAELRAQAALLGPQFDVLGHIQFASVSVIATESTRDGKVAFKLTCDSKEAAQTLHGLVMGLSGALTASRRGGPTDLLNKIKITVSGQSLTLALDLPRAELEAALGGAAR